MPDANNEFKSSHIHPKDSDRGKQAKRWIEILVLLSSRSYTVGEICIRTGLCGRTVRRAIRGLEEIEIPVYIENIERGPKEAFRWRVDPHWMKRFM